ncbi:uncharacterized protein HD556DRAFT_1441146 [Suillus plorans]|uniref:Uncharacterized protein n=1 Tax=Suillus plorans TaxID=116603 RepID=A0A9P7DKB9_9AGAM|nr:uncharacterized protein HD556DRAFT_1441146 [Suillus plorans]KAG1796970.1 hypothetical protein HD556DRAFT_1441146 [Suillus plorans]
MLIRLSTAFIVLLGLTTIVSAGAPLPRYSVKPDDTERTTPIPRYTVKRDDTERTTPVPRRTER